MTKLLPCPFCGKIPSAASVVSGTQYEIESDCGMASSSIQISDLMTIDERLSIKFEEWRYPQEYIDRAREEAIKNWNTRV